MQRFAQATGIDLTGCRPPHHHVHSSLGAVQIEVLRRLNPQLRDQLSEAQYLKVVAELFRPAGAEVAACARPAFPQEHRDWLEETSAQLIDWLATGPYAVIGDLDDLRPDWSREEDLSPDDIADEVIDEATRQLLLGTLTSYGLATSGRGKRRRHHQESLRSVGDGGNPRKRLIWTSRLRATAFGVKVWLLERADRNRVLARLAAHSVRRTRRR